MWQKVARGLELLGFLTILAAVTIGTWANFALPRRSGGLLPDASCYFTDALVAFIHCDDGTLASTLTWAWYWTWGIYWLLGTQPFTLHILLAEVVSIWLAARFINRILPDAPDKPPSYRGF
jgi:hypothetical protein